MIPNIRAAYNTAFTKEKYQSFLQDIYQTYDHKPNFRIAETPVFIPKALKNKLFQACEEINDVLVRPDFKELSKGALIDDRLVPGEDDHTLFLQMDFGICRDEQGELTPQLIEVQGFPSLYFFQDLLANQYYKHFDIPSNYNHLFDGLKSENYLKLLHKNILGDTNPKHTILLEIEPRKQTTQIDFHGAAEHLGIPICCVSDLLKEGKDVFYRDANGKKIQVHKILNRVIFDELLGRKDLQRQFYFTEEANVEWIGHPHWFFRISKHTLPLLDSQYVPKSYFLNEVDRVPDDLHNYVLKPLYSFAGTGVIINLHKYDLEAIRDPENYILQRKVNYEPVIATPDEPAKCEIRMLMLWEKGAARPRIINNLARISKGLMVGVRYNKDREWVGASVGLFEQ